MYTAAAVIQYMQCVLETINVQSKAKSRAKHYKQTQQAKLLALFTHYYT